MSNLLIDEFTKTVENMTFEYIQKGPHITLEFSTSGSLLAEKASVLNKANEALGEFQKNKENPDLWSIQHCPVCRELKPNKPFHVSIG